jgi:hypothetical protein
LPLGGIKDRHGGAFEFPAKKFCGEVRNFSQSPARDNRRFCVEKRQFVRYGRRKCL